MTTKVTVDAHAGWPVSVEWYGPNEEDCGSTVVQPGTTENFYIHTNRSLVIEELSHPTEGVQDAKPE